MTNLRGLWPLNRWVLPAFLLYAALLWRFQFVQDDAFISYRFIANFLNGNGLVFNIGERVEGYTNHGWVVLLSLAGALGLDYILVSRIIGVLSGAGLIWVTWLITSRILGERHLLLRLLPVFLVAATPSLSYWASSGLETAPFALAAGASLYWYIRRSRLLVLGLALATWLRPEGALIAFLLLGVEAVVERRIPLFVLRSGVIAFLLSLPMVGFKLAYYGSILPNSFYAKTGFDLGQISSGMEYAGRFAGHYPLAILGLVAGLLLYRHLEAAGRTLVLFALLYTMYIVAVGGDVLKVHRFFLPVFAPFAALFAIAVSAAFDRLKLSVRAAAPAGSGVLVIGVVLTVILPHPFVEEYHYNETRFVTRMSLMAQEMKATDSTTFSVALPTIGAFGYELIGHDVIDLLGLTDSVIARHPEPPIPGIESTWKERSYNSAYVLSRSPDYIIFSTGTKPSAPAELALMLYPAFQHSYRSVAWYFSSDGATSGLSLKPAFKRMRPVEGTHAPTYPIEYALAYKAGIESQLSGNFRDALGHFNRALEVSPRPYYPELVYSKASTHFSLKESEEGMRYLTWLLEQEPYVYSMHRDLYMIRSLEGATAAALEHRDWLERLVPWYLPRIDSMTARQVEAARRAPAR